MPYCEKPGCERPATWAMIRISEPTESILVCKKDIPAMMKGREEHVLYPLVATVKEDGK